MIWGGLQWEFSRPSIKYDYIFFYKGIKYRSFIGYSVNTMFHHSDGGDLMYSTAGEHDQCSQQIQSMPFALKTSCEEELMLTAVRVILALILLEKNLLLTSTRLKVSKTGWRDRGHKCTSHRTRFFYTLSLFSIHYLYYK